MPVEVSPRIRVRKCYNQHRCFYGGASMAKTDDPRHRYNLAVERLMAEEEIADSDKEAIREYLNAIDAETHTHVYVNDRGQQETKSNGALASYTQALKQVGKFSPKPLTEMSTEDMNALFDALSKGTCDHPGAQSTGYGDSTLVQWQAAIATFYRYHDALDVDPNQIARVRVDNTASKVDERDMLTRDEVEALRSACTNPRDRCILELLLYTGQRVRAIQTLRVKDIDLEEGVYYLNTDADGLKGADKTGRRRPLLGAKKYVRDWLNDYHPARHDREAALITCLPSANRGTPGEPLSQTNIRDRLTKLFEDAGVDKPANPHNFRHWAVTTMKRKHKMDNDTIRHLIGHGAGSRIMETTYSHLSDDDYIKNAEIAMGIREEDEEGTAHTPEACPTCGEALSRGAKACPGCGAVFTPDAMAAQDVLNDLSLKSMREAKDDEEADVVERVTQLLREDKELAAQVIDPEAVAALLKEKGV